VDASKAAWKKSTMKIWTQFTKKNDREHRDWKRDKFKLLLEIHHIGELKQRRKIHNSYYGKTVGRYKIEKNSGPLRHVLGDTHVK